MGIHHLSPKGYRGSGTDARGVSDATLQSSAFRNPDSRRIASMLTYGLHPKDQGTKLKCPELPLQVHSADMAAGPAVCNAARGTDTHGSSQGFAQGFSMQSRSKS